MNDKLVKQEPSDHDDWLALGWPAPEQHVWRHHV